jgi:mRNA interferase MazF
VWRVDLNPVVGTEQGDIRPALVLSVDPMNNAAGRSIVLPITKTQKTLPAWLPVNPPEGGLKKASNILCDQIRSIAHERFSDKMGEVSQGLMAEVEQAMMWILGLHDA